MLDIDYVGSSYAFFDGGLISELQRTYCVPPYWEGDLTWDENGRPVELIKCEGGPLKLWLNLDPKNKPPIGSFAFGADLSTGSGATNSCLSGINCKTGEKIAELASPFIRPEEMAMRTVALCWLFANGQNEPAQLAWEMQGPGVLFGKKVIELGFRNIYYRTAAHDMLKRKIAETPGWVPTPDSKRLFLEEYRTGLATRAMLNRSHVALEECRSFIFTAQGRIEHAEDSGGNDPTGAAHQPRRPGDGRRDLLDAGQERGSAQGQAGQRNRDQAGLPRLAPSARRGQKETRRSMDLGCRPCRRMRKM